jgi:O-antigen/teichoic acid export membrane protein
MQRQSIARNSAMNLGGFAVPLVVGLIAVPIITRELGAARFGLLSLAFAILEYSNLFDLGLGAATTREVSASLARKDDRLSQLIAGSVASQAALGLVGTVILFLAAPILVNHIFVIPPELHDEATGVFRVLALMIPPTIVLLSLRGVLEAAQRFDLSNAIRAPGRVATFLVPAVAASFGFGLPAIVMMLLIARILVCTAMGIAVGRVLPGLSWKVKMDWSTMRPLFVFGGWMSVSNIVGPLLVYLDRFMLGAIIGVAAVGYYTAPFDGVMRLLIIPASLMGAVYPTVSGMLALGNHESIHRLYSKSLQKTMLLLIVPAIVLAAAGPMLLRLWLGEAFASEGAVAIRILAFGVFVTAVARVPSGFLTALGRPDVIAKVHAAELLFHVPVAWYLIRHFGVPGAAGAWTFRVAVDAVVLSVASSRVMNALPLPESPTP